MGHLLREIGIKDGQRRTIPHEKVGNTEGRGGKARKENEDVPPRPPRTRQLVEDITSLGLTEELPDPDRQRIARLSYEPTRSFSRKLDGDINASGEVRFVLSSADDT